MTVKCAHVTVKCAHVTVKCAHVTVKVCSCNMMAVTYRCKETSQGYGYRIESPCMLK